ncbi:hypothetical protein [Cysteiniphilum sp. QT6929]|uniref:hypothetical protein n=1 Tax=Cysteiniphilum sp. QT6929 TaxID=2975055 RepID=UPI0024B33601|nr:hypothetical protein [Cysteiniphilum sp. QT6929]WHN65517.1 hypothetical protein NYP54_10855 [Cysteiniphilum sp. QT6929]
MGTSANSVSIENSHVQVRVDSSVFFDGHSGSNNNAHAARAYIKSMSFDGESVSEKLKGYNGGSELGNTEEAAMVIDYLELPLYKILAYGQVTLNGVMTYAEGQKLSKKKGSSTNKPMMSFELSEFNDKQIILDAQELDFTNGLSCDGGSIKVTAKKENIEIHLDGEGKKAYVRILGFYSTDCATTLHVQYMQKDNKESYDIKDK